MEEKNIFQIWKENGEKIPFAVRRRNWSNRYYTVVMAINIKKWPYGDAFGYSTKNGVYSNHYEYDNAWKKNGIIPCAGCYQWTIVGNPRIYEKACEHFKMQFFSRKKESVKKKSIIKNSVDTYKITYDLLQKDYSVEEIAKARGMTEGTICSHIGKLISQKFPIDLNKFVPIEKQIKIIEIAELLKQEKMKPIKEYLGDAFSYDEIRLTLIAKSKIE